MHVSATLPEAHALFFLAVFEFDEHGEGRRVEASLGGGGGEGRRAHVRESGQQAFNLASVGVRRIRTDAAPAVRDLFTLTFDPLENHRLTVAREFDASGIERAELEHVFAAVVFGALSRSVG